jgi:hypothetical protein
MDTIFISRNFLARLHIQIGKLKLRPKPWNTKETHERDAWKRVSEMVDLIYGSGHTIATAILEIRQETLKAILARSALMANGTNITLIQNQVGRSGAAMTLKYTQPENEAQLEMAQQIEDIDRNLFEKSKKRIE